MNEHASIRDQSCPNASCMFYGKTLEGNVIVHSQVARRMRCKACRKTWVTHRNDLHYRLRTDAEIIQRALAMLEQGGSIRKTAAAVCASTSTIQRWKARYHQCLNS